MVQYLHFRILKFPLNLWIVMCEIFHILAAEISDSIELPHFKKSKIHCWWFQTCFIFPIILGIMIPIDFHIFQRGGSTTNQYLNFIQFHQKSHGKSIWFSDSSKFHSNTIYRSLTKTLSKITWNHIKSETNHIKSPFFPRQLPDLRTFSQRFAFTVDVGLAPRQDIVSQVLSGRYAPLPAFRGAELAEAAKRSVALKVAELTMVYNRY